MDTEIPEDESRRKRVKISDDVSPDSPSPVAPSSLTPTADPASIAGARAPAGSDDEQALKEAEVGITEYVSADVPGFSGVVKKRYTDFLVNEILPSGTVLHLQTVASLSSNADDAQKSTAGAEEKQPSGEHLSGGSSEEKKNGEDASQKQATDTASSKGAETSSEVPEFTISEEDRKFLDENLGEEIAKRVLSLHQRALANPRSKPSDLGKVLTGPITDKDVRTKLHQNVRRIFNSRLDTTTAEDGGILFSAASKAYRNTGPKNRGEARKGKVGWNEVGGEYLHFTLYKENKDTMEVLSFLGKQMRLASKHFSFAGTKDRRGVTVQRASAYRVNADRLAAVNKVLRNAAVGDFEYNKHGLELGDLGGNEFVITLRECKFPEDVMQGLSAASAVEKASELVSKSLHNLRERGYFNYYGLQRFGTFATRTDMVGVKMLQEDFKGACDAILHFSPEALAAAQDPSSQLLLSSDDKARAEAIHIFRTTGRINDAMDKLPRKFAAESALIRHLGRHKNDYQGALQAIPRNLRLMYVHAYQSYVWNFAVGERWRLYGDKVVAGDLVLINEFKGDTSAGQPQVDADGEIIVRPEAADSATSSDDMFLRARALSAEEASSGKYTIFDVVLPLPGFDVVYPQNEMTNFYQRFMGSEQGGKLDPFNMRRKWKDISLAGSYRKILSRPGRDCSFEVKTYRDDNEQFVLTDLQTIKQATDGDKMETDTRTESSSGPEKLAVIIKFQLGASQYATMALRELMKSGGARTYKPEFGAGRS
ncbi:hypothetical protein VTO42DRAFT_1896 [Malbranchea cinnamomea]